MSESASSGLPLETLAGDIKARVALGDRDRRRSDDYYKSAGIHLIELKARIPVELPGTRWLDWAANHFRELGGSRLDQLMRIGRGETTQATINEAERERYRASRGPAQTGARPPDPPAAKPSQQRTPEGKAARAAANREARAARRSARVAAGWAPPVKSDGAAFIAEVSRRAKSHTVGDIQLLIGNLSELVGDRMAA